MLIAKCYAVALHMKDGRVVRPPRGSALMHDPSGKSWPRNSCLIAAFRDAGRPVARPIAEMRAWAVDPDDVRLGRVTFPSRDVGSRWSRVGAVRAIDYSRHGQYDDDYEHEFKGRANLIDWILGRKKRLPILYRSGRAMRLELGRGSVFNWRGFVRP